PGPWPPSASRPRRAAAPAARRRAAPASGGRAPRPAWGGPRSRCGARSRHRLAPLDDAFARYGAHDSLAALAHGRWNARLALLSVRAGRFERSSRSAPARVIWTPVPAARYTAYRPSRPGEVYPPCRPGTPWW